jgi:hypothetical protein
MISKILRRFADAGRRLVDGASSVACVLFVAMSLANSTVFSIKADGRGDRFFLALTSWAGLARLAVTRLQTHYHALEK